MFADEFLAVINTEIFDGVKIGDILEFDYQYDDAEKIYLLNAEIIDERYFFFPLGKVYRSVRVVPNTTSKAKIIGRVEDMPYALKLSLLSK